MPRGFAADDGAALHFQRRDLLRAVTSKPGAGAYSLRLEDGAVIQEPLEATYLGDEPCPPLRPPLVSISERLAPSRSARPPGPPAVAA